MESSQSSPQTIWRSKTNYSAAIGLMFHYENKQKRSVSMVGYFKKAVGNDDEDAGSEAGASSWISMQSQPPQPCSMMTMTMVVAMMRIFTCPDTYFGWELFIDLKSFLGLQKLECKDYHNARNSPRTFNYTNILVLWTINCFSKNLEPIVWTIKMQFWPQSTLVDRK